MQAADGWARAVAGPGFVVDDQNRRLVPHGLIVPGAASGANIRVGYIVGRLLRTGCVGDDGQPRPRGLGLVRQVDLERFAVDIVGVVNTLVGDDQSVVLCDV